MTGPHRTLSRGFLPPPSHLHIMNSMTCLILIISVQCWVFTHQPGSNLYETNTVILSKLSQSEKQGDIKINFRNKKNEQ